MHYIILIRSRSFRVRQQYREPIQHQLIAISNARLLQRIRTWDRWLHRESVYGLEWRGRQCVSFSETNFILFIVLSLDQSTSRQCDPNVLDLIRLLYFSSLVVPYSDHLSTITFIRPGGTNEVICIVIQVMVGPNVIVNLLAHPLPGQYVLIILICSLQCMPQGPLSLHRLPWQFIVPAQSWILSRSHDLVLRKDRLINQYFFSG